MDDRELMKTISTPLVLMKNMIISVGAENTFNKIKQLFMIKTLEKLGREGSILMLIKYIYKTLHT